MFTGGMFLKRVLAGPVLVSLFVFPFSGLAQQTVEVTVKDYQFQPALIKIRVGDTIKWINREKRTSHSVTFSADQGGESERFFPDETWQRRFDTPGSYPYHCGPHPEMIGRVVVLNAL